MFVGGYQRFFQELMLCILLDGSSMGLVFDGAPCNGSVDAGLLSQHNDNTPSNVDSEDGRRLRYEAFYQLAV